MSGRVSGPAAGFDNSGGMVKYNICIPAESDTGERILAYMSAMRCRYGIVLFQTRDIAPALDIPFRQCREYLDFLHQTGVIGKIPETPVLWFQL